jgi:hypothetical protein
VARVLTERASRVELEVLEDLAPDREFRGAEALK